MMELREAAQQALEFIVASNKGSPFWLVPASNLNKTVTALRAALAEEQNENTVQSDGGVRARISDGADCDMGEITATSQESRQVEPVVEFRGRRNTPEKTSECWGILLCDFMQDPPKGTKLYTAPPSPTWTDAHWTQYERGIVATERERIAQWVEDMCADLDAKTIANGIRNGGNDDMRAFKEKK